jgi:hypothetical protein
MLKTSPYPSHFYGFTVNFMIKVFLRFINYILPGSPPELGDNAGLMFFGMFCLEKSTVVLSLNLNIIQRIIKYLQLLSSVKL